MIPSVSQIPEYLPKYLTDHSYNELREAVREFPNISYGKFYSSYCIEKDTIYQGDCLQGLPFFHRGKLIQNAKCLILSNTCDMQIRKKDPFFSTRIVFCPIIDAQSYLEDLKSKRPQDKDAIDSHFNMIYRQEASQPMFLPAHGCIPNGGVVFFDQIYTILNSEFDRSTLGERRLFSLGNYGHYVMCIKLSNHFCRVSEADKPSSPPPA